MDIIDNLSNFFSGFLNIFSNENFSRVSGQLISAFLLSLVITIFLVPLCGRLAKAVGAVDLPAALRKKNERGITTRIHKEPKLRLGGLAMVISIIIGLIAFGYFTELPKGVILGAAVIVFLGIIDDIFNLSSTIQLFFQLIAAFLVVLSGISITSIGVFSTTISLNWFSAFIEIGNFAYTFIFPADFLTIIWIIGMINVINWVGGVDGLNGSISTIALFTILLLIFPGGNIVIMTLIALHIGGLLGVLPFNYYPSKIFYGSVGDYMNGFLLAILAILAGTKWSASLILLAMPIMDALMVVFMRFRDHPEVRRNPLKILGISDKNHFHHRLMDAGYTPKTVMLIESSIMLMVCLAVLIFNNVRVEILVAAIPLVILFIAFSLSFFLKQRTEKNKKLSGLINEKLSEFDKKEAVVSTVFKDEEEDKEQKFVY